MKNIKLTSQRVQPPTALLDALVRANNLYVSKMDQALQASGLSTAKLGALLVLAEADEPLPLGQLAERLACVKSNITQLIDRLEADRLVRRIPDARDRRSRRAAITPEGRRLCETGLRARREVERQLLKDLSPQEQGHVSAALVKIGHAAG